jgi:hypothetical protein
LDEWSRRRHPLRIQTAIQPPHLFVRTPPLLVSTIPLTPLLSISRRDNPPRRRPNHRHPQILPLLQPPHRPPTRLGSHRRLTRQRPRVLAALRRGMGAPARRRCLPTRGYQQMASWMALDHRHQERQVMHQKLIFKSVHYNRISAIIFGVGLFPLIGIFASAWLRAMDTGRILHRQVGRSIHFTFGMIIPLTPSCV